MLKTDKKVRIVFIPFLSFNIEGEKITTVSGVVFIKKMVAQNMLRTYEVTFPTKKSDLTTLSM